VDARSRRESEKKNEKSAENANERNSSSIKLHTRDLMFGTSNEERERETERERGRFAVLKYIIVARNRAN